MRDLFTAISAPWLQGSCTHFPDSEGKFAVASRRSKAWKSARKCEGMRLTKEFKRGGWGSLDKKGKTLSERCEAIADIWLEHTQGCSSSELRTEAPQMETLSDIADIDILSPAVYMTP